MHSKVSLPRDNCYQCLHCGRVYLVPWIDWPWIEPEPEPASPVRRGLQRFVGMVRAAISPHPHLPGRMGTAGDGI